MSAQHNHKSHNQKEWGVWRCGIFYPCKACRAEAKMDDTLPKRARDYDPNHPEFTSDAEARA